MPGTYLNPHGSQVVANTIGRVERQERIATRPGPTPEDRMIFSYPGAMSNGIESPPWYPTVSGNVEFVRMSLRAPASTTHTIGLKINGVQVTTFSLSTSAQTAVFGQVLYSVQYNQPITIVTVSVADSDMTVEVHVR